MITSEGPLNESDKKSLQDFYNSEIFRIARKLMAYEYNIVCELIVGATTPNELLIAQGQLRGIKQLYALFLNAASKPEVQKEIGTTLRDGRHLVNMKKATRTGESK